MREDKWNWGIPFSQFYGGSLLSINTLNSNDCAGKKGQKIYDTLHYY